MRKTKQEITLAENPQTGEVIFSIPPGVKPGVYPIKYIGQEARPALEIEIYERARDGRPFEVRPVHA